MKIYGASKTQHAPLWEQMHRKGVDLVSNWHAPEVMKTYADDDPALLAVLWMRIYHEIGVANCLVLYVTPDDKTPLKGALVEVGMALAMGKPIHVVRPGVKLGEFFRPLGSWIAHTNVILYEEHLGLPEVLSKITGVKLP